MTTTEPAADVADVDDRPNVDLLAAGMAWATAEHRKALAGQPSGWNQGVWFCGTTCCLGGWIALHTGWTPRGRSWERVTGKVWRDGVESDVLTVAANALNITPAAASYLFDSDNDIHGLWEAAERITDGALHVPEEFR